MNTTRSLFVARMILSLALIFQLISGAVFPRSARAAGAYTLTDLGTLGGQYSDALAINEAGQVVGWAYTASGETRAVMWDGGSITDLGTMGGNYRQVRAINEAGQIVGYVNTSTEQHAVLWEDGVTINLGTLGGAMSQAIAINEAGQVIGNSLIVGNDTHGFLWENGTMIDLGTLGGNAAYVMDINESGQIIGSSKTAEGFLHAFLWEDGVMTDLGTLGGNYSAAHDINDLGQVVGNAHIDSSSVHAVLWENGNIIDLGTLQGGSSGAMAINEAGQIVGYSYIAGRPRALIWDNGTMTDLGMISNGYESFATDINENGQVVGYVNNGGSGWITYSRAFVWQDGVMTDLGTLGGDVTRAVHINDAGQIIGFSNFAGNVNQHAFLAMAAPKADQTITVTTNAPASATNSSSFTVAATASSGLPVIYSSSGSCTNVGPDFTMTSGTGTCTVMYDQAGDSNYNPAPQVTETVTAMPSDTTAPDSNIDSNPSNPSSSSAASFSFSGTDDITPAGSLALECDLDGGGFSVCTSPQNYSSLSDGFHTFQVHAIDGGGNVDPTPASFTWVIDTIAPETFIISNPPYLTNNTRANFDFVGDDTGGTGVAGFECKLDSGSFTACTSPQNYSNLSEGSHVFRVSAIDAAGNVDPTSAIFAWTVDTVGPSPVVSSAATSPTNASPISVTITFSEPVNGFIPSVASGDLVITNGADSNPAGSGIAYTFDLTPSGQGPVIVSVPSGSAQDAATNGNTISNTFSITYDSVSPTATINQAAGQADPTGSSPINFEVVFSEPITGFGDSAGDVTLSGTAGATTAVVTGGPTTYDVAVSGMTANGTVIASIAAGAAADAARNGSTASTSTDNTVTLIVETTPPQVNSIVRANPNNTAAANVNFIVTFSENVTGVDASDFILTTTGVTGTSVTSVSGNNAIYTVTVDTGAGNGAIRLRLIDDDTIADGAGNKLGGTGAGNGNFNGQAYTINKTLTYMSGANQDGWILESNEGSGVGGTAPAATFRNNTASTFNLGDDAQDRQYLGILHFNTNNLPDNAVITSVTIRIRKNSQAGTDPFTTHQGLTVDISQPYFGAGAGLQAADFQAVANQSDVGIFSSTPSGGWYSMTLGSSAFSSVNLTGTTQFRLRFQLDDNDDMGADYVRFFSGDAGGANQPVLVIEYYVP